MNKLVFVVAYLISFIPLVTGTYFDIYYFIAIMMMIAFSESLKKNDYNDVKMPIMLGSASVMIYSILMGRSDFVLIEYIVFILGICLFGKIEKEMNKSNIDIGKNKLEKYFMPIISQLAIFLIIMLVMQEMTAMKYYILISYLIIYVFSKTMENVFEVFYFMITQVLIVFFVFTWNSTTEILEMAIYIMVVINTSISGFYKKTKNKKNIK